MTNRYVPEPVGSFSLEWIVRELNRVSYDLEQLHMSGYDFGLEVAKGKVVGHTKVNKFGRSTNVDLGDDTDIHDGANSSDDVAIWVAPAAAVAHNIVSTDTDDDGAPVGAGARTVKVYGLTDWDTAEVSETIIMNGTTDVLTANAYVIIHRMKVLTKGATDINAGVITATTNNVAATVTAQINIGEGQTQMAIYGVPSTKTAFLASYYASCVKRTTTTVSISLLMNPTPDTELLNFQVKHTQGLVTSGSNYIRHEANPPMTFPGPCILKIQANANAPDTDVSAGFDLYIVDNKYV